MDNRILKSFLSLAQTLHFGRASEILYMSPSTLSRSIKQLEETLGVKLFERDNRSVALTLEGEVFQRYAREALQLWEGLQNSLMEETRELVGEISMYCSVTASYSFLYDVLSEFRNRHPRIQIKLHTGDPEQAITRVLAGDEEISIGARPDRLPTGLSFKPIAISPLVFIAPKQGSALKGLLKPRVPPARWAQIPMIVSERGVARERLNQWFREKAISPRISAQVAGNEAIVSMVALGNGVGLVPQIVLENSPLADQVQLVKAKPELAPFELGLFVLRKRLSNRIIKAFWSAVNNQPPKHA